MKHQWLLMVSVFVLSIIMTISPVFSTESWQAFRQKNGLQDHVPPKWFLNTYFTASEKDPNYVFGSVQNFVRILGAKTTWLIENIELERLKTASANGKKIEYSLYLESILPDRTDYWVFVVQPYDNAQAWFDAKHAFHGRKADQYYGKTKQEFDRAFAQGIKINAELRFLLEKGEINLQLPEDIIIDRYKFQPVFDLKTGKQKTPAVKTK